VAGERARSADVVPTADLPSLVLGPGVLPGRRPAGTLIGQSAGVMIKADDEFVVLDAADDAIPVAQAHGPMAFEFLGWAELAKPNTGRRVHVGLPSSAQPMCYQRKRAKPNGVVAIKTVAHKLARAGYYILRDGTDFAVGRAFA